MVNVFALSSTAAMMPLKGVARTLPPGAAAAAGDASASVELLASGEERFFSCGLGRKREANDDSREKRGYYYEIILFHVSIKLST